MLIVTSKKSESIDAAAQPPHQYDQLLLALVLALFAFSFGALVLAFGFLAALLAFSFGAFVLALFAFGFGALVLAFLGAAGVLLGHTFGLAAHGAVTLVHAVVLALFGDDSCGVLSGLGGLVVVASGHGKHGHGGDSGKQNFLHFF